MDISILLIMIVVVFVSICIFVVIVVIFMNISIYLMILVVFVGILILLVMITVSFITRNFGTKIYTIQQTLSSFVISVRIPFGWWIQCSNLTYQVIICIDILPILV